MIDNFDIVREHLTFESEFDRYIVHIIKRSKDDKGVEYGSNETNRLIKTFYITSLEYFDRKIPVIKDMCESYGARAYILPQVRDNSACLRELLKIVVDNLENPTIKPNHLVKKAFCGYHGSRDKKWILDLDDDNMIEFVKKSETEIKEKKWTPEKVMKFVKAAVRSARGNDSKVWMVETPHGHCIVTPPFDLQKAFKKCSMMFQGVQKKKEVGYKWTGPGEGNSVIKEINGWIVKDGMCLMYYNNVNN